MTTASISGRVSDDFRRGTVLEVEASVGVGVADSFYRYKELKVSYDINFV